jgi:hypothetical protein
VALAPRRQRFLLGEKRTLCGISDVIGTVAETWLGRGQQSAYATACDVTSKGDTQPAVSVVLPTHNRAVWLQTAVKSVLEGVFEDMEVIVSNNGRWEDTRRLAEKTDDPRVRWVEQAPCGMLEHLLKVLQLARGRYVAILHDDDWWDPHLLASLIPPLEAHSEAVVAFADQWRVNGQGTIDLPGTEYASRQSGRAILAAGIHQPFYDLAVRESVPVPACAFRREAVSTEHIPLEVGGAYDIWLGYLLARTGAAAYYCPDRLVYLRTHESSDFAVTPIPNLLAAAGCQRRMLRDARLAQHRDELRRRLAVREQGIGAALLRQGSRSAARRHLGAAIRLEGTVKALGAWGASWVLPDFAIARL